ncbi:MAG TPA: helix-turn-helix transcriptional regulator [Pirellulales bacterium]|nr:helix-turn-helix transcriptional regulator [Pirellulales bacterium]
MSIERKTLKIERSPEEKKRLADVREKFQREKPGLDELIASGEYEGPVRLGDFLELAALTKALKEARQNAGISLGELAAATKIDKAALSKLENAVNQNPTITTLQRYALAIGKKIAFKIIDAEPPRGKKLASKK